MLSFATCDCPYAKAAKKFGVEAKTGEAVRKQAKPFIDWLQQPDSEEDDDDDDEDEDEDEE